VFRIFRQQRSIRQTFLWFQRRGLELPVNKHHGESTRLVWQMPSKPFISPFAPSGPNYLNFQLPVERRPQSQPLEDVFL
jgi:hypothetical protein